MRSLHRLAALGIGAAVAVGTLTSAASAAPAPAASTQCTFTVDGPALYYPTDAFTVATGGKHTGSKVTSTASCASFSHGFHPLTRSNGSTVWMYTTHLTKPSPALPVVSRYVVTGTVKVRTAPNPRYGKAIGTKVAGQTVSSPWPKGYFPNNFAQVILSNGSSGWMSSLYLR